MTQQDIETVASMVCSPLMTHVIDHSFDLLNSLALISVDATVLINQDAPTFCDVPAQRSKRKRTSMSKEMEELTKNSRSGDLLNIRITRNHVYGNKN